MPEPNRPPWRIASDLDGKAIGWLVDQRMTVWLQCDACPHEVKWEPADLDRKFAKVRGSAMAHIAPRLRCGRCRSEWLRISMIAGSALSMGGETVVRG
jgi:hypothetical protein